MLLWHIRLLFDKNKRNNVKREKEIEVNIKKKKKIRINIIEMMTLVAHSWTNTTFKITINKCYEWVFDYLSYAVLYAYIYVCGIVMSNENTCFQTCLFFCLAFLFIGKYEIIPINTKWHTSKNPVKWQFFNEWYRTITTHLTIDKVNHMVLRLQRHIFFSFFLSF